VDTAVLLIVAIVVAAAITFLVLGMFRSQGGPEAHRSRWAARATLAEMRKEGAGLPSEVGEASNQGEGPPGGQAPGTSSRDSAGRPGRIDVRRPMAKDEKQAIEELLRRHL
jgi:hypothetical protein